jgi:hypothetical protein
MGREGRAYGHKISCGPFYFNERFQLLGSLHAKASHGYYAPQPPMLRSGSRCLSSIQKRMAKLKTAVLNAFQPS